MLVLALRPSDGEPNKPTQYKVDLHFGDVAFISLTANGWRLTVHPVDQPAVDRGLFKLPSDALAVLQTEVTDRVVRVGLGALPAPKRIAANAHHAR